MSSEGEYNLWSLKWSTHVGKKDWVEYESNFVSDESRAVVITPAAVLSLNTVDGTYTETSWMPNIWWDIQTSQQSELGKYFVVLHTDEHHVYIYRKGILIQTIDIPLPDYVGGVLMSLSGRYVIIFVGRDDNNDEFLCYEGNQTGGDIILPDGTVFVIDQDTWGGLFRLSPLGTPITLAAQTLEAKLGATLSGGSFRISFEDKDFLLKDLVHDLDEVWIGVQKGPIADPYNGTMGRKWILGGWVMNRYTEIDKKGRKIFWVEGYDYMTLAPCTPFGTPDLPISYELMKVGYIINETFKSIEPYGFYRAKPPYLYENLFDIDIGPLISKTYNKFDMLADIWKDMSENADQKCDWYIRPDIDIDDVGRRFMYFHARGARAPIRTISFDNLRSGTLVWGNSKDLLTNVWATSGEIISAGAEWTTHKGDWFADGGSTGASQVFDTVNQGLGTIDPMTGLPLAIDKVWCEEAKWYAVYGYTEEPRLYARLKYPQSGSLGIDGRNYSDIEFFIRATGMKSYANLLLNGDDGSKADDWQYYPDFIEPWICPRTDNADASYAFEATVGHVSRGFTFDDLPAGATSITKVTLKSKVRKTGLVFNYWVVVEVWDGSSWTFVANYVDNNTDYKEFQNDITWLLDTPAKVNAAKIRFTLTQDGWFSETRITYTHLEVEFAGGLGTSSPPRVMIYNGTPAEANYIWRSCPTETKDGYWHPVKFPMPVLDENGVVLDWKGWTAEALGTQDLKDLNRICFDVDRTGTEDAICVALLKFTNACYQEAASGLYTPLRYKIITDKSLTTAMEARRRALYELLLVQNPLVYAEPVVDGDPELLPGATVTLNLVAPLYGINRIINEAEHVITEKLDYTVKLSLSEEDYRAPALETGNTQAYGKTIAEILTNLRKQGIGGGPV